jgi:hypothetical protein
MQWLIPALVGLLVITTIAALVVRAGRTGSEPSKDATNSGPVCHDCQSPMEEGYLPDFAYAQVVQARWVQGRPQPGLFGLRGFFWAGKGTPVKTYRCPRCGRLESYAR